MDRDPGSRLLLETQWTFIAEAMQATVPTLTRLCDTCRMIFTRLSSSGKHETEGSHHATAAQCYRSAALDCPICAVVWDHVCRNDSEYDVPTLELDLKGDEFSSYSLKLNGTDAYCIPHWPSDTILLSVHTGSISYARGLGVFHVFAHDSTFFGIFPVDDGAEQGDAREQEQSRSDVVTGVGQETGSSSTDSEEVWNKIRHWLDICTQKHSCIKPAHENANRETEYPSRLLDVGDPDGAYIYPRESKDLGGPEPYVTLSHCWGKKSHLRLLDPNLDVGPAENFVSVGQDRILIETLPRTFRDAVRATRKLGKRFLWIDSLCIVQNSKNATDWLRESSKMGFIYSKAYCTLAADGSLDNSGGLFVERNASLVNPLIIESPDRSLQNSRKSYIIMHSDFWKRAVSNSYLGRRGWALQERFNSPAIVHFGREQVFFECKELEACEIFPKGLPLFARESLMRFKSLLVQDTAVSRSVQKDFHQSDEGVPEMIDTLDRYYQWNRLVEKYTRTSLTFDQDRLVAIQGLASFFFHNFKDLTFAGLMAKILPSQLMWRVEDNRKMNIFFAQNQAPDIAHPLARIAHGRCAPSWSWASVVGPVNMPTPMKAVSLIDAIPAARASSSSPSHENWVEAMSTQLSEDQTSLVLHIRGQLHLGRLFFVPSTARWCVEIAVEGYGHAAKYFRDSKDKLPLDAKISGDKTSSTVSDSTNPAGNDSVEELPAASTTGSKPDDPESTAFALVQLDAEEITRFPEHMEWAPVVCLPVIKAGNFSKVAPHNSHSTIIEGVSGLVLVPYPGFPGAYRRCGVFDMLRNTRLHGGTQDLQFFRDFFVNGEPGQIYLM